MRNFLKEINLSEVRENNLKLIFGLGAVVYAVFGIILHTSDLELNDPLWLRLVILALGITSIILSVYSKTIKKHIVKVLFANLYIYNAHLYYLLLVNDFDPNYKLSLLVIIVASIIFIQDKKLNKIYLVVNTLTYVSIILITNHFEFENVTLAFLIFLVLVIGYFTNKERIDAFEQIKDRETLLKSINNNVYHGIFRIDADNQIIYANDIFARMLGYDSVVEVQSSKKPFKFKSKEWARKLNLAKRRQEIIQNEEVQIINRDGEQLWVLLSLTPFNDDEGNLLYYDGAIIDITDRKHAEKELMLFAAAIDHSTTSVVITDKTGYVKYVNPFFTKVTGYTFDELLGKKIQTLYLTDSKSQELWEKVLKGSVWKGEVSYKNKAGRNVTELTSIAPIRNGKREIMSFVIVSEDITERKAAEKELLQAKEAAEAANKAQEQFLSTISHELRTPMNAVIGITNLLLEENPRKEQVENLNILKYSANNLLALINDVLDLSKIEAGKLDIIPEEFDLALVIEGIRRTHALRASQKGIELKIHIDKNTPKVLVGDVTRLNQILHNLVSNAVKFTDQGAIEINITPKKGTKTRCELSFEVKDTGIGIPKGKLKEIFESFSQASPLTNRLYGGTGLGLAITKRLIELQGGIISVESQPGKGSTFSFTLKVEKSNKQSLPKDSLIPKDYSGLSGIRVLLVEDNKVNQKVATKFLQKWDAEVDIVASGKEAIKKIKTESYDLVLMDLLMPDMDGYEATKQIRRSQKYKDLPIIALTASAMRHERENAFEAGVDDYICKPFIPSELYSKITKYAYRERGQQLKAG